MWRALETNNDIREQSKFAFLLLYTVVNQAVTEPVFCGMGSVFAVIVLLKDPGIFSILIVGNCRKKGRFKNMDILKAVHVALDTIESSNAIWCDATPDINFPRSQASSNSL